MEPADPECTISNQIRLLRTNYSPNATRNRPAPGNDSKSFKTSLIRFDPNASIFPFRESRLLDSRIPSSIPGSERWLLDVEGVGLGGSSSVACILFVDENVGLILWRCVLSIVCIRSCGPSTEWRISRLGLTGFLACEKYRFVASRLSK